MKVLIDANAPDAFQQLELCKETQDQSYAINTPLVWSLFGNQVTYSNRVMNSAINQGNTYCINVISASEEDDIIHEKVENFWKHENCINNQETAMSINNFRCLRKLEAEVRMVDGKYVVPMLCKEECKQLPNNYLLVNQRLKLLQKSFKNDEYFFLQYKETIGTCISQCYAKKMSQEELKNTSNKTWCFSHHPVFHLEKPKTVRVVRDATAR